MAPAFAVVAVLDAPPPPDLQAQAQAPATPTAPILRHTAYTQTDQPAHPLRDPRLSAIVTLTV